MRQTSLKKLLCLFMVVSATLVMCVSAYMGYHYLEDLKMQNRLHAESQLDDLVKQTESRLEVISENLRRLSEKSSIISFMSMTAVEKLDAAQYLRPLLDSYTETEPAMCALYLCSKEGILLQGHSYIGETGNFRLLRACYRVIEKLPLQDSFRSAKYMRVYQGEEAGYKDDEYLIGVSLPLYGMEYSGAVVALIDLSEIFESITDGSKNIAVTYAGESLWMNGTDFPGVWEKGEVLDKNAELLPLTVYLHFDNALSIRDLTEFFKYNVPLILCVLAIEMVLLIAIYLWVIRQIEHVAGQMEHIGVDSDTSLQRISISSKSSNEIVLVARGVNGMLARVDELNKKVSAGEINYLNSQIMFLKSQINPHFLFNSLSCIRGMASLGSVEHIRNLTECIAGIYRYSMEESVLSTVREEIGCLRMYARSFEVRYENKTVIETEIEDGLQDALVPRMILQPLVENAYLHSFALRNFENSEIILKCRKNENMLVMELENSGEEMPDEVLESMNQAGFAKDKQRGIGIYNVRTRIRLLGGENAALTYRAKAEGGVVAEVRFPLKFSS